MFDWLGSLLKAIWDFIEEFWEIILIVAIIVICIWFPALVPLLWGVIQTVWGWIVSAAAGVASFFAALGIEGALAAAIGIGFLLDPEGTASAIGGVITDVGTGLLDTVLDSPLGMVGVAALGLWGFSMLFGGKDDDDNQQRPAPQGSFAATYREAEGSTVQQSSAQTQEVAPASLGRNRLSPDGGR